MFEELHLCAWALARHLNAPFANERARYLSYCAERGDSQATLASKANRLIYVARQLSKCPELDVAIARLRTVSCGGKGTVTAAIAELQPIDVDRYLAEGGAPRWRRISVRDVATALRAFFRYGAIRGWSPLHLADSIQAPRVYTGETLPSGPDWTDVRRMLAATNTKRAKDLRDRPILMLFAIYGLRVTEVARLRLEDFDWEHRLLHVTRVKRRGPQTYPL